MGDIQIGNKAKLYSGADPFTNDGWVRLMKADGSAAYSGSATEGFAANNLYSQNDTTVNRNLIVNGTARLAGVSIDESEKTLIQNWQDTTCLQSIDGSKITMASCDRNNDNMFWSIKPNRIVHVASGKCMQHQGDNYTVVNLGTCSRTNVNQSMVWDQANSAIFVRNPKAYDNSGWAAYLHTKGSNYHGNDQPYLWDSGCRAGGHNECTWVLR